MARPTTPRGRARAVSRRLAAEFPGTARELCALRHGSPFELLAATILSAQCTDARVNQVLPDLLARFPDAPSLAAAPVDAVAEIVRSTGFYRAKATNLVGMAQGLVTRFGGDVPERLEDLVTLPGVGRKTANVVRSVAFDLPGLPVDTHVGRLTRRLGLTVETDPVRAEAALDRLVPPAEWGAFSLRLILHGRRTCVARKPRCAGCVLADLCPSADPAPAASGRPRARRNASSSRAT